MTAISLKKIAAYLNENKVYPDELRIEDDHSIAFRITNGDWKHEHLRYRYHINQMTDPHMTDYNMIYEEPSDSDTFTADYVVTFDIPVID